MRLLATELMAYLDQHGPATKYQSALCLVIPLLLQGLQLDAVGTTPYDARVRSSVISRVATLQTATAALLTRDADVTRARYADEGRS